MCKSVICSADLPDVQEILPDEVEEEAIDRLVLLLKDFESITKALQANDVGLGEARVLYHGVIEKRPLTRAHLEVRSNPVEKAAFETAVGKVQHGVERQLTAAKCKSLHHLLLLLASASTDGLDSEKLSFAERLLKQGRVSCPAKPTHYMDLQFIAATTNFCERLFWVAKFAMRPWRARVLQAHIENQLFSIVNASLWSVLVHVMLQN